VDALTQLYREVAKPLLGYAMSLTGDLHSAEDILSETFVRATEHCIIKKEIPVRAWFYKVARNIAFDFLRKKGRLEQTELPEPIDLSVDTNPEASLVHGEDIRALREKVDRLPEQYRSVLMLREINSLSYAEIAAVLGVSQDNVKVLLYRARCKIRDYYGKEKDDE
jgi:RNA polymerase sigma factor (sigma-70 family)